MENKNLNIEFHNIKDEMFKLKEIETTYKNQLLLKDLAIKELH